MKINILKIKLLIIAFIILILGIFGFGIAIISNYATADTWAPQNARWDIKISFNSNKYPISIYSRGLGGSANATLNNSDDIYYAYDATDFGYTELIYKVEAPNGYEFSDYCRGYLSQHGTSVATYTGTVLEIISKAQDYAHDYYYNNNRQFSGNLIIYCEMKPNVSFNGVTAGGKTNQNVTITWDTNDKGTLDGKDYTKGTTITAEGAHTINISDSSGRILRSYSFVIDKTAPVGTLSGVNSNNCK